LTLKVSCSRAIPCSELEIPCKTRIQATVLNTGRTTVTIEGFGIRYPRSSGLKPSILVPLSVALAPGEKASVYLDFEHFRGVERHDIIFVQEAGGKGTTRRQPPGEK
jgi:hypothetical protein